MLLDPRTECRRINMRQADEFLDFHHLGRFRRDLPDIFVLDNNVFPFFVFIAFNNLVPRHFFAVNFSDPFVADD